MSPTGNGKKRAGRTFVYRENYTHGGALIRLRHAGSVIVEFLFVVTGSLAAGWFIGTAQHYIAWGLWYPDPEHFDFSGSALGLASLEGGITGMLAAVPTGLLAWLILRRHATVSEVCRIVLLSLAGGCAFAAIFGLGSALITPFLTEIVAVHTARRRWVQGRDVRS